MNANLGKCGVAGHSCAQAKVIATASQEQRTKWTVCSIPVQENPKEFIHTNVTILCNTTYHAHQDNVTILLQHLIQKATGEVYCACIQGF